MEEICFDFFDKNGRSCVVLISRDYGSQSYEIVTNSGKYVLKLLKIILTYKFHPLDGKISTGTTVPVEKVKKILPIIKPMGTLNRSRLV